MNLKSRYFKESYYNEETIIDFNNPPHVKFAAADTETRMYLDGKMVDATEASKLYVEKGSTYIRQNLEVRGWAFMLYFDHTFLEFQNIEDWLTAVAVLRIDTIVWYNARFDYALFDYYFLTHNWKQSQERVDKKKSYGKITGDTFQNLIGTMGQRYSLVIWKTYKDSHYKQHTHKCRMLDICNILDGGLKKNLEDWKIDDENGNPIRKLEMDYDYDTYEESSQYHINDAKGLYYLALKMDDTFNSVTGFSYLDHKYITVGGLAKKYLLKNLYPDVHEKSRVEVFQKEFPIGPKLDALFREHHFYRGGLCCVNPDYKGKTVRNVYKYDVNSLYPSMMYHMTYPVGHSEVVDEPIEGNINVLHITKMTGVLKPKMIPIWQDIKGKFFTEEIFETDDFFIFEEELKELENWYWLEYDYKSVFTWKAERNQRFMDFVADIYHYKCNTSGVLKIAYKKIINSSYGKLAEKLIKETPSLALCEDGYVHLVPNEPYLAVKGRMNIVLGARVSALGRVTLMKGIRAVCQDDVKSNFLYCDTDSVHSFCYYDKCDDRKLGWFKNEGNDKRPFDKAVYLAPKTYLMYDNGEYLVHCKGVNTRAVEKELYVDKTPHEWEEATNIFKANRPFSSLTSFTVKGGRALIETPKYILKETEKPKEEFVMNRDGVIDID